MGDRKDNFDNMTPSNENDRNEEHSSPPISPEKPGHLPPFYFSSTEVQSKQRRMIRDLDLDTHEFFVEDINKRILRHNPLVEFLKRFPELNLKEDTGFIKFLIYAITHRKPEVVQLLVECCDDNENFPEWQKNKNTFGYFTLIACQAFACNDPDPIRREKLIIVQTLLKCYFSSIQTINNKMLTKHFEFIATVLKATLDQAIKINTFYPSTINQHNFELFWILYVALKTEIEINQNPIYKEVLHPLLHQSLINADLLLQSLEKKSLEMKVTAEKKLSNESLNTDKSLDKSYKLSEKKLSAEISNQDKASKPGMASNQDKPANQGMASIQDKDSNKSKISNQDKALNQDQNIEKTINSGWSFYDITSSFASISEKIKNVLPDLPVINNLSATKTLPENSSAEKSHIKDSSTEKPPIKDSGTEKPYIRGSSTENLGIKKSPLKDNRFETATSFIDQVYVQHILNDLSVWISSFAGSVNNSINSLGNSISSMSNSISNILSPTPTEDLNENLSEDWVTIDAESTACDVQMPARDAETTARNAETTTLEPETLTSWSLEEIHGEENAPSTTLNALGECSERRQQDLLMIKRELSFFDKDKIFLPNFSENKGRADQDHRLKEKNIEKTELIKPAGSPQNVKLSDPKDGLQSSGFQRK